MESPPRTSQGHGDPTTDPDLARAVERVAQEWRASVDATPDVIVMLARDFRILRVNRAASQFFGHDFPKILGRRVLELLAEVPSGADPFHFERLEATRKRAVGEVYLRQRRTWVSSALDPILDGQGQLAGAVLVLRDISDHKRTDRRLQRSLRESKRLSAHLEHAREEERSAIAREIHDEVGNALTVIKMEAAWWGAQPRGGPPRGRHPRGGHPPTDQDWRAGMRSIAERVDVTIAAIRRLATELRPEVLDSLGIAAAIEWQAGEFQHRTAIPTSVQLPGILLVDRDLSTVLFRVCQEALTNVARHAQASSVTIRLWQTASRIVLEIEDDGRGFRPNEAKGGRTLGLLGMQERVQGAGGRLLLRSAPAGGTVVAAHLPVRRQTP